jgi:GH15 family glucan-1,4-alpha-glucosidase
MPDPGNCAAPTPRTLFFAVMSWAGCNRLAEIAARMGKDKESIRWGEQAATMHARILAEAWNPQQGSFVSTLGGDTVWSASSSARCA